RSNRRRGAGGGGVGRGSRRPRRTRARAPHARAQAVCRRGARPGSLASRNLRLLDLPCRTPRFLRFATPRASVASARDGSNDCVHLPGHRTDGGDRRSYFCFSPRTFMTSVSFPSFATSNISMVMAFLPSLEIRQRNFTLPTCSPRKERM